MRIPQVVRWKATKRNYIIAREVTILWGQVDAVLDLVVAFLFGSGLFEWAIPLFILDIILSYIDSKVYLWVQEQMGKDKVLYGKRNGKSNGIKAKKE